MATPEQAGSLVFRAWADPAVGSRWGWGKA